MLMEEVDTTSLLDTASLICIQCECSSATVATMMKKKNREEEEGRRKREEQGRRTGLTEVLVLFAGSPGG